jgi:hypothetical protein
MRQPGGAGTVRETAPSLPRSPMVIAATASDSDIQLLVSSVLNWQPRGFFDSGFNPGSGALSFGPGLLGLLSQARES